MSLQGLFPNGNELRVELTDWNDVHKYAKYSTFEIGSESTKYQLTVAGYSGTAGDSLSYHNRMRFSTLDQDNDAIASVHCAFNHYGAWWYNNCHESNLNGLYTDYGHFGPEMTRVDWWSFPGSYSMKSVEMKMRRK